MKKWKTRWLGLIVPLVLFIIAIPVMAATSDALVVDTGLGIGVLETSTYGVCPQPYTNTFYAEGRVWIFYLNNDTDFCYKSVVPGGALSAEHTIIAGTGLYAVEFCMWYDDTENTVHYSRHVINDGPDPDEVVYRMGTPNSAGTITWAAGEQLVSTVPAELATWRTVISVDETHNPWVSWVDTDGTNEKGIVYIEASTTHNGTWTQNADVSSNWSVAEPSLNATHAWYNNLCPIGSEGDLMHLGWTSMNVSSNASGLYAVTFNVSSNTSAIQTVVADGSIYADRPDAFDFYDIGSAVYVAYTDDGGAVVAGGKSQIQDWDEASFSFAKETPDIVWIPTLSGYKVTEGGGGTDLLCIVHNEDVIYTGLWTYGDALTEWDWTLAWQESDENDTLSRHNAAYEYSSPVAFAWQITDDSDTPDTDDAYLWWIDNSNDGTGWYQETSSTTGADILRVILPIAVAIGVVLAVLGLWGTDNTMKWVTAGVIGVVVFYAVWLMVNSLL